VFRFKCLIVWSTQSKVKYVGRESELGHIINVCFENYTLVILYENKRQICCKYVYDPFLHTNEAHRWCNGLSAVNRGLESLSGQTKDYEICIYRFSHEPAASQSKSKDCTRNQKNVFEWNDMSTRGLLFQCTIKIKLRVLV
jgi:hypothetical protein